MSRIDPTSDEELSLEFECDCGAKADDWCVTVSGAYSRLLHRARTAGLEYCVAVESYDCKAPAGYQVGGLGGGISSAPGVKAGTLTACGYCGEPVCSPCSTLMTPPEFIKDQTPQPVCINHNENELAQWLGLEGAA